MQKQEAGGTGNKHSNTSLLKKKSENDMFTHIFPIGKSEQEPSNCSSVSCEAGICWKVTFLNMYSTTRDKSVFFLSKEEIRTHVHLCQAFALCVCVTNMLQACVQAR